jgi:PKD repeat protein
MGELCDIDHTQFTRRSLIGFFTISGLALASISKVTGQKSDNSCIYWTITNKQAEKISNNFDISNTDLSLLLNDLETTSSGPNILYMGADAGLYDPGNGNIQQVDPGVMAILEVKLPDGENRGKYVKSYSSTIDCDRIPFERGIDGEITITPSSPAQGESVVLEASPIGIDSDNVVSYEWKFGDTDSVDKIGQVIKTKFNQRQTIVSVKMSTDVGTSGKATMTVSATPNPSLSPTFSYYPSTPRTSDEVQFNASDSKADGTDITAYEWDFTNDGTVDATGAEPVHTFDPGTHTVILTVRGVEGTEQTTQQTIDVTRPASISPSIESQPSKPVAGEPVRFDATNSTAEGTDIAAYEWDFTNDGTVDETGSKVVHTFEEGTYAVSLTIEGNDGEEETTQKIIEVAPEPLNIAITSTDTEVPVGGQTSIQYSVNNYLNSQQLTLQLLVEAPNGISVTGIRGAQEGSNQFTAETTLSPASQDSIRIDIKANSPGEYTLTAVADYYFQDQRRNSERVTEDLSLTVTGQDGATDITNSSSAQNENEKTTGSSGPGFGAEGAIAAIGGAVYALRNRLSDQ